jgi:DNA polymerase-1
MVRLPIALADKKLSAKMLLQVHDELIFETPDAEIEKTQELVKAVMERAAHPAIQLRVPLTVDARAAANWDAAH